MSINSASDAKKFEEKKARMKKGAPGCSHGECSSRTTTTTTTTIVNSKKTYKTSRNGIEKIKEFEYLCLSHT